MTIYAMGSENVFWDCYSEGNLDWDSATSQAYASAVSTASPFSSGGTGDDGYIRSTVSVRSSFDTDDYFVSDALGGLSEVWVHYNQALHTANVGSSRILFMACQSFTLGSSYSLNDAVAGVNESIVYYDGSSVQSDADTYDPYGDNGTQHWVDVHINLNAASSENAIEWYVDEVLIDAVLGSEVSSSRLIDYLFFSTNQTATAPSHFSEIVAASFDTRGMRSISIPLDGAGNHTDWTGAYTDINDPSYDSSSYISTATAADRASFTVGNVPSGVLEDKRIEALAIGCLHQLSSGTSENAQLFVRIGGTDYDLGAFSVTTTLARETTILSTSPATGITWSESEINSMEVGVKSESAGGTIRIFQLSAEAAIRPVTPAEVIIMHV